MHEKLQWFNENIQFMFHGNIVEYDMKAASLSVSERFNLLPQETIDHLKLLPKERRTREVGLLQREDKEFSEKLISSILNVRKQFLESNGLDESNVIVLHSDACMFNSLKKINSNIDGVEFKKKNTWTSYIRYKNVEMFYVDGYITYKGIPVDMVNQHTLGINKYLVKIFDMMENYDTSVLSYLSTFQAKYLEDKLPSYYYIPFGTTGTTKISNLEFFAFIANVVLADIRTW